MTTATRTIGQAYGGADVVVHAAGIMLLSPLADLTSHFAHAGHPAALARAAGGSV